MGEHQRSFVVSAAVAITAVSVLAGCSAEGQGTSGGAASAAPTASASRTADLQDAVLTTAELPTGGWTAKPDQSSSGGETSTDKSASDVCEGDFGSVFDDAAEAASAGSDWTREATSSAMSVTIIADADAAEHVRGLEAAIRSCPTSTTFTSSGQQTRVGLVLADLGSWGDERACLRLELQQGGTSAYTTTCFVADADHLVGTSVLSRYNFELPKDDEVQQITTAAVDKAARVLG